ncbi:OmpA family protein, partial [Mycobacterium tuberculosis]|nr:OmpA family protein [Mycobacterium tuberculosis]
DFTVNVGDRIFFDVDSSVIRADAQQTLSKQAQWLQRYPNYTITVEGHADERGTREYNLALGQRRAAAARNFLASRGLPPSPLSCPPPRVCLVPLLLLLLAGPARAPPGPRLLAWGW